MALAAGTQAGPYRMDSLLGTGGMGVVYRAGDTRPQRAVALKVLPPGLAADAERQRRFEQEARAVAALNHPNILSIFDVGTGSGPLEAGDAV
ncbi:MAG: protein kinase domain-containing protein [Terriglobales bacterium]